MEFLKKSFEDTDNPRNDNSDKKKLFDKSRHPKSANEYKEEWSFIEDVKAKDNVAYQLQYLEFNIRLYNDYQIYLTIESLLCKNLMVTIAGIVECVLYDQVDQMGKRGGYSPGDRRDFVFLINFCYDSEIISKEMKDAFHELRKIRNLVHLSGTDFQEHQAYTVEETNYYIKILSETKDLLKS